MMRVRMTVLSAVVIFLFFALGFGLPPCGRLEGRFVFREVLVEPLPARPGDTVEISIRFAIEGGPYNVPSTVEISPPLPGPPPPTLLFGNLEPGEYTRLVCQFAVPAPPPERICLTVRIGSGELRGLCLQRIQDSSRRWLMEIENRGRWAASTPIPRPAPSTEKPDLRWVGRLDVDSVFRLENAGPGTAYNIHVKKHCLSGDRWVPAPGDKEVRVLGPGASVPLELGRLGQRAFGPCVSKATRVRVFADPENLVEELDEDNNILESSALPDLQILQFSVIPGTARVGEAYSWRLIFKVHNAGPGDASSFAWDLSVLRRQGPAATPTWLSFLGVRIPGIAAGETKTIFRDIGDSVAWSERTRLRLDTLDQVLESNEENNSQEFTTRARSFH